MFCSFFLEEGAKWQMNTGWLENPKQGFKNATLYSCPYHHHTLLTDFHNSFKLRKWLTAVPQTKCFEFDDSGHSRGHSLKLLKTQCTKDVRKYFFSYRVINRWYGLTDDIVNSPSINSFKNKLQKLRDTLMGVFWTDVCNPLVGLYWSIRWVQPDELRLHEICDSHHQRSHRTC